MSSGADPFLIPQENEELFSSARAVRITLLVSSIVGVILVTSGIISFLDILWIRLILLPIQLAAVGTLFLATIPVGYYGVELAFGAGRSTRVITKEGPSFRWPWMTIMWVDQRLVDYRDRLIYRAVLGTLVAVDYSVLFRASPDIRDNSGRNRFIETVVQDPTLRTLKGEIRRFLDYKFGWVCRAHTAEELLLYQRQRALELLGRCLLKLRRAPHEHLQLSDSEILSSYYVGGPTIEARIGKHKLRPVLAMDYPAGECGRYRGERLDGEGRIADPRFHEGLSHVERYQGIEVMDFSVKLSISPSEGKESQ